MESFAFKNTSNIFSKFFKERKREREIIGGEYGRQK